MFGEYKNKIIDFYRKHKRMPAYREIMSLLNFKSTNAVYRLVNKMVDQGVLSKDKSGRLIPNKIFGEVPMLGLVKAGFPAAVEEEMSDTINIDDYLIEKKEFTYLLEVDGDSMIDAHIEKGDMVIAVKAIRAKDGDIVIAEVDGEWTMKYYRESGTKVWLEPANKRYKPIYPTQDLRVAAIVKGVIRKY